MLQYVFMYSMHRKTISLRGRMQMSPIPKVEIYAVSTLTIEGSISAEDNSPNVVIVPHCCDITGSLD